MNRRAVMLSLVAASAIPLPFASRAFAKSSNLESAEEKYLNDTLATGALSLETSRLAVDKARSPWTKKFAQYEVAEQETLAAVLKETAPSLTAPPARKSEVVEELSKASGAEFDAAYLRAQLSGHNELLEIHDTYIKTGGDKPMVGMAKLARGQVKEHLDMIKTIQQQMKG